MNHRDAGMIGFGGLLGASVMGWALAQSPTKEQRTAISEAVKAWTITSDANAIKAGQYLTVERTGQRVDAIHVDVLELCKAGSR